MQGEIWHVTNESVQAAKREGIITAMDEGAVAVLMMMAERLDDPDWPVIDNRFDNVTQSVYLKACDQLGLTPSGRKVLDARKEADKGGKLAQLRAVQGGAKTSARKRA
jgi:hypothetical protein